MKYSFMLYDNEESYPTSLRNIFMNYNYLYCVKSMICDYTRQVGYFVYETLKPFKFQNHILFPTFSFS